MSDAAKSYQRKNLKEFINALQEQQAAESEWFRAETADDPQWQALLADPHFQALENERAAIIAEFGQKLARFRDRFREDLTPEEGAEADHLQAERQARLSALGERYRLVAGMYGLPKPQRPGPTAFEITQGIQGEFSLELPELAEQLALLALDIGSGTFISQPIRQNVAQLSNAVRLQYRAVAMERKETAPGKFQWIKKRGERTLDDRRLEHYLVQCLAVLSDLQEGRKSGDAAERLRAMSNEMKAITSKANQQEPFYLHDITGEQLTKVADAAEKLVESLRRHLTKPGQCSGPGSVELEEHALQLERALNPDKLKFVDPRRVAIRPQNWPTPVWSDVRDIRCHFDHVIAACGWQDLCNGPHPMRAFRPIPLNGYITGWPKHTVDATDIAKIENAARRLRETISVNNRPDDPPISAADLARALSRTKEEIASLQGMTLTQDEMQRRLEAKQVQVMRLYFEGAAAGILPRWIAAPATDVKGKELLVLWDRLAGEIERALPGRVPERAAIADSLPIIGEGRKLYFAPPDRWIDHACSLVAVLLDQLPVLDQKNTVAVAGQMPRPTEHRPGAERVVDLPGRAQVAAQQYDAAAESLGKANPTDREAYACIVAAAEAEGKKFPYTFKTWGRYLRLSRQHTGQQKHKPRGGKKGRSTVTPDEV